MKNRILSILLSVFFVLSLSACGTETSENKDISFDEYQNIVRDFNDSVLDASIILSNVGQYEHNYWEALENVDGTIDYDKMVESAMNWLEEKSDSNAETVETSFNELGNQYSELVKHSFKDNGADEISDNVSQLFSAYNSLYNLVIEPSGNIDDFADQFNEYSSTITDFNSLLLVLLGE